MMGPAFYALGFLIIVGAALFLAIRSVNKEYKVRASNPHMIGRGMRGIAGTALTTSSLFLIIVAVMLNSPQLFYMSTAVIATLGASRFQAWLSVMGLHFERLAPEKASVGELVTVEMLVWSDRKIRRPLVTIVDLLPSRIAPMDRTPSLPIAPAYDVPIRTQYRFRPMRRGRFKWTSVQVNGTDALGLVTMFKTYSVKGGEMLVVPTPIPIDLDLPAASGWGISETEAGQGRGIGIEPRGVREYSTGDSIRYIHWPSSARTGRLMVREFETGAYAVVAFFIQRTYKTDIGHGNDSTLERICSNVAYLSESFLRQGAQVSLPQVERQARISNSPHERQEEILIALAGFDADTANVIGDEVIEGLRDLSAGSAIYVMLAIADEELIPAIKSAAGRGMRVNVIVYDPAEFLVDNEKLTGVSACDPDFMARLQSSGATVARAIAGVKK